MGADEGNPMRRYAFAFLTMALCALGVVSDSAGAPRPAPETFVPKMIGCWRITISTG
jgi:hypothetical protein